MFTLSLGLGVALSSAKDWTTSKRTLAIMWLLAMDTVVFLMCGI
jgi:hypothetical protein